MNKNCLQIQVMHDSIIDYIQRRKRLKRDQLALKWKKNSFTCTNQEQDYEELLQQAETFFNQIESQLDTRQLEIFEIVYMNRIESLNLVYVKLNMSRTTLFRERKKIETIIDTEWKVISWWFEEYMSLDHE